MLDPDFNYKFAFLLFFFVQALIFAGLSIRKGKESGLYSGRWLSAFLFLSAMYITPWMLGMDDWYAYDGFREFLFFVPFYQFFLLGPVIYFYTLSLLDPSWRLSRKDWVHFIPAGLYLLYSLVIAVTDLLILEEFYFYADGRDKDLSLWYQISGLIWMIYYSYRSLVLYQLYRRTIFHEVSFAETITYTWIRRFLFSLLVIFILRVLFFIFFPGWGSFGDKWWYFFAYSIVVWYISIEGYTYLIRSDSHPGISSVPPPLPKEQPRSQPSELLEAAILEKAFQEDQIHRNPGLTISDLAEHLGVSSRMISSTINQTFQKNFNDFVNGYRVDDVKQQLRQGVHHEFTILSIALESGFNSKATFNRVFKKVVGETPAQFARKQDS